jgi:hypothetical protein
MQGKHMKTRDVYVLIFYPHGVCEGRQDIQAVFETREAAEAYAAEDDVEETLQNFPDALWDVERHYLHLSTPSLANAPMEPEKPVREGGWVDDWIADYTINGEHWVRLGPYEPQKYDYETSGWVKVDGRRLELHAAANTLIAITDDRRAWVLDLTMRYEWNPASGEIREV